MQLKTDVQSSFLNLFTKAMENEPLERDNKMNLFVLKAKNNCFDYGALTESLKDQLIFYALSRHTVDELVSKRDFGKMSSYAREKLRKAEQNTGELGELLLYCFLEAHLQAPKLLTKLELKTAANDYVKGADGVHLLQLDDKSYQIVFCESKLYKNLHDGIEAAFKSILTMLDDGLNKIFYERHLIDSNLLKENVSDAELKFLKKILIPTENDEDLEVDDSFGVFIGFEIPIIDEERKMNNSQFRTNIIEKVKQAVTDQIDTINNYLRQSNFVGYQFYFYIIPFSELAETRTEIIKNIVS